MARPRLTREERKQDTRRHLIQAGIEAFAKMGFNGASIDKIVQEAGYTKGAFYAHFASKEELFLTIFEDKLQTDIDTFATTFQTPSSVEKFIEHMSEQFYEHDDERRIWDLLRMEFVLFAMRDEKMRKALSDVVKRSIDRFKQDLSAIYKTSEPPMPLEQLAWMIVSFESGMAIYHYLLGEQLPAQLFEQALRAIMNP